MPGNSLLVLRTRYLPLIKLLLVAQSVCIAERASAQLQKQSAEAGIVKVYGSDSDGGKLEGSGFVVGFAGGNTFILSAAHVIGAARYPTVSFAASPHNLYAAEIVGLVRQSDLALLKLRGTVQGTVNLPLDLREVSAADPLHAVGFPQRSLAPTWASADAARHEGHRLILDRALEEGHSGGPVLRGGWVVGMVRETKARSSYALPGHRVIDILRANRIPYQAASSAPLPPATPIEVVEEPETRSYQAPRPPIRKGFPCYGTIHSQSGAGRPLRKQPSLNATAHTTLPLGTQLVVSKDFAGSGHRWYQVRTQSGRSAGWIQGSHIALDLSCP